MLDGVRRDFRFGCRSLSRNPGFTAAAVLILALSIGANTTIFTLVNGLFLAPPPQVEAPRELVRAVRFSKTIPANLWTYPDYDYFRDNLEALAGLAAFTSSATTMSASLGKVAFSIKTDFVSNAYFDVLGVQPAMGRTIRSEKNQSSGSHPVAMISYGFWQRAFDGAPDAVGSTIDLNGHPCTIVGIVPRGFRGVSPIDSRPDVWVPIVMQPVLAPSRVDRLNRGTTAVWLHVAGRLRSGTTLEGAQANVDAVAAALAEEVPAWAEKGDGVKLLSSYRYVPQIGDRLANLFELLTVVVAIVLAIACVNVALLLLARSAARHQEIGMRLALGAPRRRIVGQLMVENFLLAAMGGVTGFFLAFWSADLAARALPHELNLHFAPDLRVLLATLGLVVVTTLLFGATPVLVALRTEIVAVLKPGSLNGGKSRLSEVLVAGQIALAIVLVIGAAHFVRSFRTATSVSLGYEVENRLVISMNLGQHGYSGADAARFLERALVELKALPGVRSVSAAATAPFQGMMTLSVGAEGRAEEEQLDVGMNFVGPGFFETMGIPLTAGRDLSSQDRSGVPMVAVISASAAEKLWPGKSALGRRLSLMGQSPTVVAVAQEARFYDLAEDPEPFVYIPMLQFDARRLSILLETETPPEAMGRSVEDALRAIDPRIAFGNVRSLSEIVSRPLGPYRVGATLVGLFSALALLLAMLGLYGLMSYLVVRRTRVIGVQMALGATARWVARSVLLRALLLAALGIPFGLAGAWASSRFIEGFLFQVNARDPVSYFAGPLVLLAVVCLAGWLPAWRASRVDPTEALRES